MPARRHGGPVGRGAPGAAPRAASDLPLWLILAGTLALWFVETGGQLGRTSHYDQYVRLADAFLHGQLHLRVQPPETGDLALVDGRFYVVFGPFPAVLLMPLVAVGGLGVPDVLVVVLTALLAILCFHRLIGAVHGATGPRGAPAGGFAIVCTTLSFALGTALHYGAPMGNVWLHAQITALALQCWALWMAAVGRGAWCGVALGLTVLTRPTVALVAPLAIALLVRSRAGRVAPAAAAPPGGAWLRATAWVVGPILVAVLAHGLYDRARFGSFTDMGYGDILMSRRLHAMVERHGRFGLDYLPHNLAGWVLRLPRLETGGLVPDPHGMSLLLSVPFLWLLAVPRRHTALVWVALATATLIAIPALLYHNDGWVQFGQRFSLDWIAPVMLVCSFAAARAPRGLVVALTVAGIVINAWGLAWFQAHVPH